MEQEGRNELMIKKIKEEIEWAKREIENPDYADDETSLSFFKGILSLESIVKMYS